MHLRSVTLHPENYPTREQYPFCLPIFQQSESIAFTTPITLFVGENGAGKSTLIKAICQKSGIHIWRDTDKLRCQPVQQLWMGGRSAGMAEVGNCWDNAPMENFFGHLKEEAIHRYKNPAFQEAQQIIDEYIYFFNYERIQLKTKQTPYQIRCLSD